MKYETVWFLVPCGKDYNDDAIIFLYDSFVGKVCYESTDSMGQVCFRNISNSVARPYVQSVFSYDIRNLPALLFARGQEEAFTLYFETGLWAGDI